MVEDKLNNAILKLLEPGIYKTTAQVVEEVRMEYPNLWRQLENEGEMLYGNSCSSVQQPYTRISQVLLSLPSNICLRKLKGNKYTWSSR